MSDLVLYILRYFEGLLKLSHPIRNSVSERVALKIKLAFSVYESFSLMYNIFNVKY